MDDLYWKVSRQGTKYLIKFWLSNKKLLKPNGKFSLSVYEKYGYYEGYSEGLPGSEEFNLSAVGYGCYFHLIENIDMYINLGQISIILFIINIIFTPIHVSTLTIRQLEANTYFASKWNDEQIS